MLSFKIYNILINFFYIDRSIILSIRKYEKMLYKALFITLLFYLLILRNSIRYNKILENTNRYIQTIEKYFLSGDVSKNHHDMLSIDGLVLLIENE